MLFKAYFDQGYALTNYFFKLVAVFGLTTQRAKETFIILFFYTILCYFIGRFYFFLGLKETEIEINNRFNPFAKEVRNYINKKI